MDEDGTGAVAVTAVAALALFTELFLPLFKVAHAPPGGAGVVNGHPMNAFTDPSLHTAASGYLFPASAG